MKIVGILLARIYMQRLKNYRVVIHIKNHNLCIILILSFLLGLLVSYLQRRIKCAFKNCGEPGEPQAPPPQNILQGRARASLPPLPRMGRVNQSCLTADMWFHLVCGNTIPVRSKRSNHCDRDRVCHPVPL